MAAHGTISYELVKTRAKATNPYGSEIDLSPKGRGCPSGSPPGYSSPPHIVRSCTRFSHMGTFPRRATCLSSCTDDDFVRRRWWSRSARPRLPHPVVAHAETHEHQQRHTSAHAADDDRSSRLTITSIIAIITAVALTTATIVRRARGDSPGRSRD